MTIDEIKKTIQEVSYNYASRDANKIMHELSDHKQDALLLNDQKKAKEIWCLEQVLEIQEIYIEAFKLMKDHSFYEAWRKFEQIQIINHYLHRHYHDNLYLYKINIISMLCQQFQSLYPYRIFFSPEIVEKERKCSICNKVVRLRNPCGHILGEIYDGELCYRIVTKAEFISVSVVTDPVQKYSVAFIDGKDHYDYRCVQYVSSKLLSPFHIWEMRWTKTRHPHSFYSNLSPEDTCPCGSNLQYKSCCLPESGVLRPHCDILFSESVCKDYKTEYFY